MTFYFGKRGWNRNFEDAFLCQRGKVTTQRLIKRGHEPTSHEGCICRSAALVRCSMWGVQNAVAVLFQRVTRHVDQMAQCQSVFVGWVRKSQTIKVGEVGLEKLKCQDQVDCKFSLAIRQSQYGVDCTPHKIRARCCYLRFIAGCGGSGRAGIDL